MDEHRKPSAVTWERRRVRDPDSRSRALIEAARDVFAERGYDRASTREIAARAGCSTMLIRYHFGGKRGLFLAVMAAGYEKAKERLERGQITGDLREDIENLMISQLESMWDRQKTMRVVIGQAIVDPDFGSTMGRTIHQEYIQDVRHLLSDHRSLGQIRAEYDLDGLSYLVTGVMAYLGFMSQIVFGLDRGAVRRLTNQCAEVIANGMAANHAPPAK